MKKLKQSSALLLMVSFLLSIFSFSVFAVGKKVKVHIEPKHCTNENLNENQNMIFDGSARNDVKGQPVPNARFKLYKVGNVNQAASNQGYKLDNFPFDQNQTERKVSVNGQTRTFRSNDNNPKIVTTNENGIGIIEISEPDFGWYCAIMDDQEGKECEPILIYVNTTNDERDIYAYPKVIDNEIKPEIKKYIIGQDGKKYITKTAKQGDKIKYRLEVSKPYLSGYYSSAEELKAALNDKYSVFKVHDELLRFNQIVNRDNPAELPVKVYFVKGDGNREELREYNGANNNDNGDFWLNQVNGKGIIVDFRRGLQPNRNQDRGFSDNVANLLYNNRNDDKAHFEIEFEVEVNDLTKYFDEVNPNNAPNYQEQREDVKNLLDYHLFYQGGKSIGKGVKSQMSFNKGLRGAKNVNISLNDYDIENFKKIYGAYIGKELNDDGTDGNALPHGGVKNFLKAINTTPGKLGDIKNPLQNSDRLKLTPERKQAFTNLLKVDNEAYIELKNDKIFSNRVRTQFGLLYVRKLNKTGESLSGAEFELKNEAGESFGKRTSNNVGSMYFIVPVGTDKEYQNEDMNAINKWLNEDFPKTKTKYKLQETKAPEGYEKINTPFEINVEGTFNYFEVVNAPGIKLPFTGGVGTILFMVVGVLLIGSGAFLYMNSRRKKSAE